MGDDKREQLETVEALTGMEVVPEAALFLVVYAVPVDAEVKLKFITFIVGIYAGANVAQKMATVKPESLEPNP